MGGFRGPRVYVRRNDRFMSHCKVLYVLASARRESSQSAVKSYWMIPDRPHNPPLLSRFSLGLIGRNAAKLHCGLITTTTIMHWQLAQRAFRDQTTIQAQFCSWTSTFRLTTCILPNPGVLTHDAVNLHNGYLYST